MGRPKREHLRSLLAARGVEHLTDLLYAELESAMLETIAERLTLIDGTMEFATWLRDRSILIGTTTGYTRAMMKVIAPAAARQGYVPDVIVTPDDVPMGRPAPFMMAEVAQRLRVGPPSSFVKIGDTPADIAEGRNIGAVTIGLALTGNALGLDEGEFATLPEAECATRFAAARNSLREAGADYVVDGIADCREVLLEIYARARDAASARRARITS